MPDDYSANAQTAGAVAAGGSATGTIEAAYDRDWFAVERFSRLSIGQNP